MNKITELAINYKQTKNPKVQKEILTILEPQIVKKAKYIYYQKWYPLNYFHKCKYCQHCKNKNYETCKECTKCLCDKGYFNLSKSNMCEIEDVKNDLILKVLELIEQFDITKDFYTFFGVVWMDWRPSFITQDFIKSFSHKKIYQEVEVEGEETEINIEDTKKLMAHSNLTLDAIFKKCQTKSEKAIYQLYLQNPEITEEEIGKKLKMTQQNISLLLKKLRKKLKNLL